MDFCCPPFNIAQKGVSKENTKQSTGKLVVSQNSGKSWRNSEGPQSLGSKAKTMANTQHFPWDLDTRKGKWPSLHENVEKLKEETIFGTERFPKLKEQHGTKPYS